MFSGIAGSLGFLLQQMLVGEKAALEEEDIEHTSGNSHIGDIENRFEEEEGLSPPKGHPFGKIPTEHGEIEHVHYFSMQEGSVTSFRGE